MKKWPLLFLFLLSVNVMAKEIRYLSRSPEALLKGDAFTAQADDEYTLFYNPAGLGKTKGLQFTPLNPAFGLTNAYEDQDRFKDFPKRDAAAMSQRIMGFPIYTNAGIHPSVKFGPFGFSAFLENTTSLTLRNAVYPQLDIFYRYDRGFIVGFAHSIGSGGGKLRGKKNSKKVVTGQKTSIGGAFKHITREGLDKTYDLFGPELTAAISGGDSSNYTEIRRELGYSKGSAWGADLGILHSLTRGSSELSFGASVLDIGDTKFKKQNASDPEVPQQDMLISTGVSWSQNFTLLDYSLSLDMKPINKEIEALRALHVGFELGFPILRLFSGWGEGYISYGLTLDFFAMKLTAGVYGVELGSKYQEEQGKRAVIYLSLVDFQFDM